MSMVMSCSSTEQLPHRVLISVVLTSMSTERRPKPDSLLHPRLCSQLQGKWGSIARLSYSTHTVISLSQSSDKDKSPVTTCGLRAVLRPLHLASTVPLQAAVSTTRDVQGRMVLRHRRGFHSTPVHGPLGKPELLHCPLTSSAGVPFSSSRYFFTTASGSVGVAAQGER